MKGLLFILFLIFSTSLVAQTLPAMDSSKVIERQFNEASLEKLRKDKNFQYESQAIKPPSLWERFWIWVWETYHKIMQSEAGRITLRSIFWILMLLAVGLFIFKVLQMNRTSPFSRSSAKIDYTVEPENIHAIDFQESLRNAISKKNFRLALRLWYLQMLKIFSDQKLIDWQINKTNSAYLGELKEQPFIGDFKVLTNLFESVWYGNKEIHENEFFEINNQFESFRNSIKG